MDAADPLRRKVTRTYVIALSVIAVVMTAFVLFFQYAHATKEPLPALINIAGKQRMLSQRIALLQHNIVEAGLIQTITPLQTELRTLTEEFLANHAMLSGSRPFEGRLVKLSDSQHEHYFRGLLSLDNIVNNYAARALDMANQDPASLTLARLPSVAETRRLLERLDRAVVLYEERLSSQLHNQRWQEATMWLTLIVVMLLSVLVLFKPLETVILRQFSDLHTARRNAERERQNTLMAHRAKVDFLSKMSHEFRTPISAIIGALELIPNMRSKQESLIQQAEQASFRLLAMTNNLLDIIDVSSANQKPVEEQFDLIKLMEECFAPMSATCRQKSLDFTMRCESQLPQFVTGHPANIGKAIKNVLDNAVKFTEKGFVSVLITLKVEQGSFLLTIKITDTGIGIAESEQENIFKRFYQADAGETRRYAGAGVGLTLAQQHLEAIGGTISVSSQLGVGSEFMLTIPLHRSTAAPTPRVEQSDAVFAVVDDLEISRLYVGNIIEGEGFRADTFKSGSELLARHDDIAHYAGIIADFYMPGISGIELARTISAMFGKKTPPLILMSATPDIANIVANSEVSAWQVFIKPLDRSRFIDTLHQLALPDRDLTVRLYGKRILVVEDEPINAEIIHTMVTNLGYKPDLVFNGDDALTAVRETSYDAILLDINLPDISGLDVARIVREMGMTMPIIATTANAFESDKEKSYNAGIRYHLVKPITYQELKNTLRLALTVS